MRYVQCLFDMIFALRTIFSHNFQCNFDEYIFYTHPFYFIIHRITFFRTKAIGIVIVLYRFIVYHNLRCDF